MSDVPKDELMEFCGGPADGLHLLVPLRTKVYYLAAPERRPVWPWGTPFDPGVLQEVTIRRARYDRSGEKGFEFFVYTGGFDVL
jgi:hypothetical protein